MTAETAPQLELRAHHLKLIYSAVKKGIPEAVNSITAVSEKSHHQVIGPTGEALISYSADTVGTTADSMKAYKEVIQKRTGMDIAFLLNI